MRGLLLAPVLLFDSRCRNENHARAIPQMGYPDTAKLIHLVNSADLASWQQFHGFHAQNRLPGRHGFPSLAVKFLTAGFLCPRRQISWRSSSIESFCWVGLRAQRLSGKGAGPLQDSTFGAKLIDRQEDA